MSNRFIAIDVARGIALIAMTIFHFGWDLENFGIARAGMTLEPQWKYFARAIAASFLVLVGVSAWFAHRNGINKRSLLKRVALVGGAALVITIVTWFATPNSFIFFGILHNITVSSVLVLLLLRAPWWICLGLALVFFIGAFQFASSSFNAPWVWWTGLNELRPQSNDYVPLFPWFGWVLVGFGTAKLADFLGVLEKLSSGTANSVPAKFLAIIGRHSLIYYLLHQPIMIGLLYVWVKLIAGT